MSLKQESKPNEVGVYQRIRGRAFVIPLQPRIRGLKFPVPRAEAKGAKHGDLVEYFLDSKNLQRLRITKNLGAPDDLKSLSEIAVRSYQLADTFPEVVLEEANRAGKRERLESREDLRDLKFITIDPEDARDHDDAVFAYPTPNGDGGHVIWVAIADVAHFVHQGTELCEEASRRGNSTYLPDMVLPMLPEALSGDACSLREGHDRPCLAVKMVVDGEGRKQSHQFVRGLIRSHASLSYQEAQAILSGAEASPLKPVLLGIEKAYRALQQERIRRQPLELDIQERKVRFSAGGQITDIVMTERLECHKIIEEFMILANVCAAETLTQRRIPYLCRIHAKPKPDKIEELSKIVAARGVNLAKQQRITTKHLNNLLLKGIKGRNRKENLTEFLGTQILRSMQQAVYSEVPDRHFGLNLNRYVHFTSPIRRYADLVTHRALIRALELGLGGASDEELANLGELAKHLSACERRSAAAERDSLDRFTASYLSEKAYSVFDATITSVLNFGIFVRTNDIGAEGLVPVRTLGFEYFHYDASDQSLNGERSGRKIRAGQQIRVRLHSVDLATGQLSFRFAKRQ